MANTSNHNSKESNPKYIDMMFDSRLRPEDTIKA